MKRWIPSEICFCKLKPHEMFPWVTGSNTLSVLFKVHHNTSRWVSPSIGHNSVSLDWLIATPLSINSFLGSKNFATCSSVIIIPWSPNGAYTLLSVRIDKVRGLRKIMSLTTPSPPLNNPSPPVPSFKSKRERITGYLSCVCVRVHVCVWRGEGGGGNRVTECVWWHRIKKSVASSSKSQK